MKKFSETKKNPIEVVINKAKKSFNLQTSQFINILTPCDVRNKRKMKDKDITPGKKKQKHEKGAEEKYKKISKTGEQTNGKKTI